MSEIEEEEGAGIPEWVVTFGDMMSLLLTFFIMLVSLSEIKEKERFQAMVESFRKQFGHTDAQLALIPGQMRPRNSSLAKMSTMGRAMRFDTHRGGDKVRAPVGDFPRVRIVRPGSKTTVGTVIFFPADSTELLPDQLETLHQEALQFGGKPQKIEVRGHTSPRPLPAGSKFSDHWNLAYERCRRVQQALIDEGIDPARIRLSVAGATEPLHTGTDPALLEQNSRVEVFMLDEYVDDLRGSSNGSSSTEEETPPADGASGIAASSDKAPPVDESTAEPPPIEETPAAAP